MSSVQGRILIAEDEPKWPSCWGAFCTARGSRRCWPKTESRRCNWSARETPTCCCADLRMPGMDGMELMRKAKDLDPELPVILLTGYAEVRGAVEALRAGAHDYLAKPFDNRQVIRVVLRALNERRLKLQLKHLADHVHQALSPRETFGPSEGRRPRDFRH